MSNPSTKKIVRAIKPKKNPEDQESKVSAWLEDYLDCFTFKMKPVTDMFIERISQELITWASTNPDAIKLTQFFNEKRIPYDTWNAWVRYPQFKAAKELALSIIGDKREHGGLTKKYDASMVQFMMPKYDQDWKDIIAWRAKVKAESESGNEPMIITRTVYKTIPTENSKPEMEQKNVE